METGMNNKGRVYIVHNVNKENESVIRPIFSNKNADKVKVLNISNSVFKPVEIDFAERIERGLQSNLEEATYRELCKILGNTQKACSVSKELCDVASVTSLNESMRKNTIIKQLYWLHNIVEEARVYNADRLVISLDAKIGKHEVITLHLLSIIRYDILVITGEISEHKLYKTFEFVVDNREDVKVELNPIELKTLDNLKTEIESDTVIGNTHIIGYNKLKEYELNNFLVWLAEKEYETDKKIVVLKDGLGGLQSQLRKEQIGLKNKTQTNKQCLSAVITRYSRINPDKPKNVLLNKEKQLEQWSEQLFKIYDISKLRLIVIYGKISGNTALFLEYLNELGINTITVTLNESEVERIPGYNIIDIGDDTVNGYKEYPKESIQEIKQTITYNLEQEIRENLYGNLSIGLYKDDRFYRCETVKLVTTFEELLIYWKEKAELRPHFEVISRKEGDVIKTPVFFAKISGTNDTYKEDISRLIQTPNTILKIDENIYSKEDETMQVYRGAIGFGQEFLPFLAYKDGKINIEGIQNCPNYRYGILLSYIQEHIFMSIENLMNSGCIRNSESQQIRDKVLTVCLNMSKRLIELTQQLEFTGTIPKIVLIRQNQNEMTIEDSIMLSFLNLLGFDIILVVPSGYRIIENNIKDGVIQEHIIGRPDFNIVLTEQTLRKSVRKGGWFNRLFSS